MKTEIKFNKIFCIGLSRTGTTSLYEALNLLGIKTVHFPVDLFLFPENINQQLHFQASIKKNLLKDYYFKKVLKYWYQKSLANTLDQYIGFADLPIPLYYRELDQKFPDSKFIYTYRTEEAWLKSMEWMLTDGAVLWRHDDVERELNFKAYQCITFDREKLLTSYRAHHNQVIAYFKDRPDDLLVLKIEEGQLNFKLICGFLGLPIPSFHFPKSNGSLKPKKKQYVHHIISYHLPFLKPLLEILFKN